MRLQSLPLRSVFGVVLLLELPLTAGAGETPADVDRLAVAEPLTARAGETQRIAQPEVILQPLTARAGETLFVWQPLPLFESTVDRRLTLSVEHHTMLNRWLSLGALADVQASDIELAVRLRVGLACNPAGGGVRGFALGVYPGYLSASPPRGPPAFPVTLRITYTVGSVEAPLITVGAGVTYQSGFFRIEPTIGIGALGSIRGARPSPKGR